MPCHHKLETYLDEYVKAAGIEDDRKGPLFRSATGKTGQLSDRPMLRGDAWRMVRRRASDAGIEAAIGCHTFRAAGITDHLTNGGRIEARSAWPDTRTRKQQAFTTVARRTSAWAKPKGSGFEREYPNFESVDRSVGHGYRRDHNCCIHCGDLEVAIGREKEAA